MLVPNRGGIPGWQGWRIHHPLAVLRSLGRRSRLREGALRGLMLALLLLAGGATGTAALQQEEPPPDSTRIRQLQLLRDLARGPGADSARLVADSARLAGPTREREAGRPITATDSIMAELLELAGFSPTEYAGASAEYRAQEGMLFLFGDSATRAAFRGEGYESNTDSIIEYDQEASQLRMWGDVVSIPVEGDPVQSRYLACDVNDDRCLARQARTQFREGADWIATGDLPEIRAEVSYGHEMRFTSCDLEVPHYHFEADQFKVVNGNIMVARSVRLYFADVPVAWLPFIAQSLSQGRASGLLTPTFSVNDIVRTSGGYRRRVSNIGFYWAMNDYMDALVAMDWFDDNYTALTGSYRYQWLRQFLQGNLDFRQFWRAEGGTELTLNTRNSWELSERTSFRMAASYASSTSFITRNSFNPQEVTQSIDSEGGLNHRFDWGSLSVNGNRRQFLSDDRVETTFPSASLSLKTITLFPAPVNRAGPFNNLTWSGSGGLSRSVTDLAQEGQYVPGNQDRATLSARANSSLNLGRLSVSGGMTYREGTVRGLRDSIPDPLALVVADEGIRAFSSERGREALAWQEGDPFAGLTDPFDATETNLDWNASVDYQQTLVGSTTLTPRISFSGQYRRIDTLDVAQNFVAGPTRTAFGATLKSDLYGFFPGVGNFERIRHKLTPSFTYDWSPEVTSTPLQAQVFGSRNLQPRNVLAVTLNQTFEAKRRTEADTASAPDEETDSASRSGEPQRVPRAEIVNLLSLRTSAVRYDFVEAGDLGFLQGFQTVQLTNQISSDFLRGLSISMVHDLFQDAPVEDDGTGGGTGEDAVEREFAPKLTRMNLGFSLNNRSTIFRWLGLIGGGDDTSEPEEEDEDALEDDDPLAFSRTDETSMIPGARRDTPARGQGSTGRVGEWSANISYAMTRPREGTGVASQMVQASLRLQPTDLWEMSWRTSYDLEAGAFNDHSIRLSRDLHRWRANFDFLQTATGNWSFRFEVSLLDNDDLKFDYQQRNVDRIGGRVN